MEVEEFDHIFRRCTTGHILWSFLLLESTQMVGYPYYVDMDIDDMLYGTHYSRN